MIPFLFASPGLRWQAALPYLTVSDDPHKAGVKARKAQTTQSCIQHSEGQSRQAASSGSTWTTQGDCLSKAKPYQHEEDGEE